MLNIEQLLIKTAQYFDLDLNKLGIKHTDQKKRLFTRNLSESKYGKLVDKLFSEIALLNINPSVKKIIDEFIRKGYLV